LKNNDIKTSQKSPPIIKPKVFPVKNEVSSSRSVGSNSDEQEHEMIIPPVSVGKIKLKLERNAKESAALPMQTQIKPVLLLKPTNTPPPVAPKPGKLVPPLSSKPSSTDPTTDKKPPLPPRKFSNASSNNEAPPPTPPRPSSNGLVVRNYKTLCSF